MFSVQATREKFENATITGHLDLCLRKTCQGGAIVFEKLRFQIVFHPDEKKKAGVSKFLWFKDHFRVAPFSRVLVWTVGLTTEIELRFERHGVEAAPV